MDKTVRIKNAGIREDLGGPVRRETFFQRLMYIACDIFDQSILSVLKNTDLIQGFLSCVQMIVPVWNEPCAGNDFPNAFPGLFAPVTAFNLHFAFK